MASEALDQCLLAQETTGNWQIVTILLAVVILDITSVFLLTIYGHCYLVNKSLHPNLKALIICLTLCFIVRNTLTLIRASRMLVAGVMAKGNPCYLLTEKTVCGIESLINATPLEVACWTFCIISIERTIATFFYKRYEGYKFITITIICCLIPWIVQGIHVTPRVINAINAAEEMMPYCSSISSKAIDIFQTLGYIVPVAVINIAMCVLILYVNMRAKEYEIMRTDNGADYLTAKFQRLENIEATRAIAIHCVVFLLSYVANVFAVVLITDAKLTSLPLFAIMKEASSLTFPVHGNIHVLLGLAMSVKVRQQFYNHWVIRILLCRRNKHRTQAVIPSRRIAPLGDQNDYFNVYNKQWT